MTVLIDTHALLWYWWDDPKLSEPARNAIRNPDSRKLVSYVSPWEVAIKVNQKKLELGRPFEGFFDEQMSLCHFQWAPITPVHFPIIASLPEHHKDIFDRMLIVQAQVENCPIVTKDGHFAQYNVTTIW